MTATPMLDKVRQYAKDWGVGIVGDRSGMSGTANLELRPDSFPFTHDGPGIFSIHWPTRTIVEPIATVAKRKRVATDSDAWYLIHEISHILLNVDPEEVDEIASAIIALDYHAGRHLGLTGWDDWMGDFTLPEMEIEVAALTGSGSSQERLRRFGATLAGRELEIFRDRIVSDEPATLKALGDRWKISRERVRQLEKRILMLLRDHNLLENP